MNKSPKIALCKNYTTTGHPDFKPLCRWGFRASLKCHSERKDCKRYEPSLDDISKLVLILMLLN